MYSLVLISISIIIFYFISISDSNFIKQAKSGKINIVKLLLKLGANPNATFGEKALVSVSKFLERDKNKYDIIKLLIDNGADINSVGIYGGTALTYEIYYGNKDIVELLIDNCADVNFNLGEPLKICIGQLKDGGIREKTYEEICKLLLENGADPNIKYNDGKESILNIAIKNGNENIVELLISYGADVNSMNNFNQTPLMYASKYGYDDIVELLVNNGADINTQDDRGRTALMYATDYGKKFIINFLLENGADPNIKNKYGETALNIAGDLLSKFYEYNKYNDINFSIGGYILHWQYKNIFAEMCGINKENDLDKLEKKINNFIDKLLEWSGGNKREELEERVKNKEFEHFNNIYDLILFKRGEGIFNISDFGVKGKIIEEKFFLNLDSNLLGILKKQNYNDYLKKNGFYLNRNDFNFNANYINLNNFIFNFIFDLFKNKSKIMDIEEIDKAEGQNFKKSIGYFIYNDNNVDLDNLSHREKEYYEIYSDFCKNFNKDLLMDVIFNYKGIYLISEYGKYNTLIEFDINNIINLIKEWLYNLPEELKKDQYKEKFKELDEKLVTIFSDDNYIKKDNNPSYFDCNLIIGDKNINYGFLPDDTSIFNIEIVTKYIKYQIKFDLDGIDKTIKIED